MKKGRVVSIGIYVSVCLLMSILCFWVVRFVCSKADETNSWLMYEAESCALELEELKKDCQERLNRCSDLEGILWVVGQRKYDVDSNNCLHFSRNLRNKLEEKGIRSSIVKGKWDGRSHYWVVIWIEAIGGKFIKPDENYILEGTLD